MSTRILVIEDSATEALRARLVLEREGYQVSLAADGKEGLSKAIAEGPDLIVLDTIMPRMSGFEVWEKLRADARTRDIPVILLTHQEGFNDLPSRLGCGSFVSKPYQPTQLVGRIKDIAAERYTREAADGVSAVIQQLGVGTVTLCAGRIVNLDRAAEVLLETDRANAVGKSFAECFIENQGSFSSLLSQVQAEGRAQGEFKVHLNGSGKARWWKIVGGRKDIAGQPAICLTCMDLTEEMQAKEEMERLSDRLQQTEKELEKAKRAKGNFLATMSHELRTPLHECMGMTDLALGTDLTPEQRQYLETARNSANTLLALVNDILEFTELEARQVSLDEKEFDLRSTLEGVVAMMSSRAQEKGLTISCELPPDVPTDLIGDPRRLRQVLMNLLSNAIKFTEQGKVGVDLKLEHSTPSEVELHFRVHDTGIGIPKDKLELIFDVFQQADDSTTRRYGGMGLGLTMSEQLVRLMGGRIWAESKVDKGSIFHFTAKLKRQKALEASPSAMPAAGRGESLNLRILLAEDSPTNQLIAVANLKKAGHTVQVANNGRKAVDAWEAEEFDLVLMDVAMPEMDGLEATQAIRQKEQGTGRHIPIIAMTAFALKEYQDKCRQAGMDAYVTKPVNPDELQRTITPFLERRRQQPAEPPKPAQPPVRLEEALEVVGGDVDLLKDVVQMSLEECPEQVQALTAAVEQKDAHSVERSAHRLKGIMGNLGGMMAREAAQILETMGGQGNLGDGPGALRRFMEEFQRVVAFYSQPGWEKSVS